MLLQAQEKAAADAEAAQVALQAAQEKADNNEARAVEAENKLAAEVAAHTTADNKLSELEVHLFCFQHVVLNAWHAL